MAEAKGATDHMYTSTSARHGPSGPGTPPQDEAP